MVDLLICGLLTVTGSDVARVPFLLSRAGKILLASGSEEVCFSSFPKQEAGVVHGAPGTGGGLLGGLLGRGRHSEAGASLSRKPAALVLAVARLARS